MENNTLGNLRQLIEMYTTIKHDGGVSDANESYSQAKQLARLLQKARPYRGETDNNSQA